jgi:hypothetical protein
MIVCAAGDSHGALNRLYADVLDFEASLGVRFEWVLHVGDFGAWPDPSRIDGATRRHEGAGDFPAWWSERRAAPRRTVFIKGNHEDFVWLDAQSDPQILPGLFYLRNATRLDLADREGSVVVGGLGGCFGPSLTTRGRRSNSSAMPSAITPATRSTRSSNPGHSTSCSSTTRQPAFALNATGEELATSARPPASTNFFAVYAHGFVSSVTTTRALMPLWTTSRVSASTRSECRAT